MDRLTWDAIGFAISVTVLAVIMLLRPEWLVKVGTSRVSRVWAFLSMVGVLALMMFWPW